MRHIKHFFFLIVITSSLYSHNDRCLSAYDDYETYDLHQMSKWAQFKRWLRRDDVREGIGKLLFVGGGLYLIHECWAWREQIGNALFGAFADPLGDDIYINGMRFQGAQTVYRGITIIQKKVPHQRGTTCGFCAVRDAKNVHRNVKGEADGSLAAWQERFDVQKGAVVAARIKEAETDLTEAGKKKRIATANDNYTDAQEIRNNILLSEAMPEEQCTIVPSRQKFILSAYHIDIPNIINNVTPDKPHTVLLGNMRQIGDKGVSNGHWISATIIRLPNTKEGDGDDNSGPLQVIVTDSMNSNRLDSESIRWVVDQIKEAESKKE